ncbi:MULTISPECIES: ABC transporter permease [unclassified Beijerinckia]|uniref:cell division protein FtsX n=1 Tax=unclassified Beijerinckia TaxID=2638183 RepID=UPI00089B38F3|nr:MULTISPECIES: ABC transporter permease [unclassified Beijerinckia]MDH7798047.1 cell division transport system permease protein [Beijerinckia sp. GAS462]SED07113.1 cell division transport system permease protein [Beijerinckia sp. 28-YEA-48]
MTDTSSPEAVAPPSRESPLKRSIQAFSKPRLTLIPADSTASRALVIVIAIMTFLATLTGGGAMLIYQASQNWNSAISREMTIQVKPQLGRDIEADVRKAAAIARMPGFADVRVFTREESSRLLEPWLGAGLDLSELPVPRLIVLKLADDARPDLGALRTQLSQQVPNAALDDHHLWLDRLSTMSRALVVVAVVILLLVLLAMVLAVAFATRGAMAGSREIIDVLHFVGARNRFIAAEFQRHFLKLGLRGGLIGGVSALVIFYLAGLLTAWWIASPEASQVEAMFGRFSLGFVGYLTIIVISAGIALLTAAMSRSVVLHRLRRMN